MARKKIQGITIEIGGNTTKLQTALRDVDKRAKDTQATLRDLNKLLKLDPGNVELLTQKQKYLNDALTASKERLGILEKASEEAYNAMISGAEGGKEQFDAVQREIIETKQEMDRLTGEMQDFGSVTAQRIKAAGEKVKDLGDKIERVGVGLTKYVTAPIAAVGTASVAAFNEVDEGLDIIVKKTGASGKALENMENQAKKLATSIPTDFKTAGEAIGEVNTRFGVTDKRLENLSKKFIKFAQLNDTSVSSSIDAVQASMAAFDVSTSAAGDVLDTLNKAGQDTGISMDKLTSDLTANATVLRELGFRYNTAVGFLAALDKNGVDASGALSGLRTALKTATKDGKSMSSAMNDLMGKIKGAKSETKAMQIAAELFGSKSGPAMAKAIREGRLSFEEFDHVVWDAIGSIDRTFESTIDPIDEFKMALNELKIVGMDLVTAAAPMIKQVAEELRNAIGGLREWWEGLSPLAQETIVKVGGIAAAAGPLLIVIGKVISAVGTIMGVMPQITGMIGVVKGAVTALWGVIAANPVVAVISAAVAALVVLYNKCEWFRDAVNNIFSGIVNFVKGAIEKIKAFFNFEWKLPEIKLPHFKIEGKFSLNPPSIPHISVDWYRKAMENGMILNSPTILPAANGTLRGFGDAGPEAVVGVDSLRGMIQSAVNQGGGRTGARNLTVIFQVDKAELGRTVYALNNEETQRVGMRLAPIGQG